MNSFYHFMDLDPDSSFYIPQHLVADASILTLLSIDCCRVSLLLAGLFRVVESAVLINLLNGGKMCNFR